MGGYAWVTLATNNSYSLGALVLAHSLKKSNTAHKMVVLISPAVSEPMREQLQTVFDVVKMVDVLDSKDEAHLALMKRPDLGITFTKIHCWRLVEFEKCVFLDADTLVVRNCDELFEREEFSAAPDVSWPDCFNSGVFVFRPSIETFNKLLQFAVENRSFDGGDQGLLNQFFSNWATEDIKKHLPFVYNLTSIAAYSYIPAFKHYGSETRIVHFIGEGKPWLQQLDVATRTVVPSTGSEHLAPLLQQWWDVFCEKVHPNLDKSLESNNDGMPQPQPVDACSNSVAIALTDEPQTARLTEPCTPYREKDDFRQYNLPYQPFDVKGSSGELLNVEFMLVSASEQGEQPPEGDRTEESFESNPEGDDGGKKDAVEGGGDVTEEEPAREEGNKGEEGKTVEEGDQNQQQEPPPVKEEKECSSFFPDENYINNYMEQNVMMYQPFESHHEIVNCEREPEQDAPSLQRFLAIPEDDQRQSGNIVRNMEQECNPNPPKPPPPEENPPPREPTPPKEEPITEKRELSKSKSMSFIPSDFKPTQESPPRSIWKSQPNLNVDPNRRYSMPKLKPILPKQNSFSKSVPSAMPKVTLYTEFLMSSEYKDPVDLPNDKIGFVESHIHKEARLRRCKSDADIRSKFGPLPYAFFPEVQKPVIPKKFPPRNLDNEIYDLSKCKRQMGNKPKPKNEDERRENVRMLPALKPIAPTKDKKSTLIKKRKSKELSPGVGGREKMLKREPKVARERRRESKITPRNVSTSANGDTLDQILQKLREFSKDYQHFFGVTWGDKRKTVKCKNAEIQVEENEKGECRASEAFETVSMSVNTRSMETQTGKEAGAEFRQFRNYVKDKRETSQKGLLSIQDILGEFEEPRTEIDGSLMLNNRVVRAEREDDAATEQEYSKRQTEDRGSDKMMVKAVAKEEIESTNIPGINKNSTSQSRNLPEVQAGEKTFPESNSKPEVAQTRLQNDSETEETSKLDSAATESEKERSNSSDVIKTPKNGDKSKSSVDSGQFPSSELSTPDEKEEKTKSEVPRVCLVSGTTETSKELDSKAGVEVFQTAENGNKSKDRLDCSQLQSSELQSSDEKEEKTKSEASRVCLASKTTETGKEIHSKAEESEEVRPNIPDSSDEFQTAENGKKSKDSLDCSQLPSSELQSSSENDKKTKSEVPRVCLVLETTETSKEIHSKAKKSEEVRPNTAEIFQTTENGNKSNEKRPEVQRSNEKDEKTKSAASRLCLASEITETSKELHSKADEIPPNMADSAEAFQKAENGNKSNDTLDPCESPNPEVQSSNEKDEKTKPEASRLCLTSETTETSKELNSKTQKSEEILPNSCDVIKTPQNGVKLNDSMDSGQLPRLELSTSDKKEEKTKSEVPRLCPALETPETSKQLDPEPEKSEETPQNTADSSEIFHTAENGNQTNDSLDPGESPGAELQNSNENGEERSKEHSRKKGCDSPPSTEQEGRNPEHNSSTAKTPTESQPIKNGISSKVAEAAPVVSSHVIIQPHGKAAEPQKPQQKPKPLMNWLERPKNPNEILCVPDFETPRSSRVTLPTAADKSETIMAAEKWKQTIPEKNGEANGADSPEGPVLIVGKKRPGRKSSPPSPKPSTPPQNGGFQDLNGGSGIAGAIAQLSLDAGGQAAGSAAASAAQQEYLRRQNWETGNMDYMGRDSFDNIWSKICQTLEAKETEEAAAAGGSPAQTTAEEQKPEAVPPTEDPVTLATILQKCPEFIETLPGDPAAGPVEDDEIIFSKPENRRTCLTNITEDEEGRTESAEATGKVKLSDILQPGSGDGSKRENILDAKAGGVTEAKGEGPKGEKVQPAAMPATQITPPTPEQVQLPVMPAAEKTPKAEQSPPAVTPAGDKVQPAATPEQVQPPVTPTAEKTPKVEQSPPAMTPSGDKAQPAATPATPEGSKGQTPATPTPEQAQLPTAPTPVQVPPPATPGGDKVELPAAPAAEKSPETTALPPSAAAEQVQPPAAPASQPAATPTTEKPPPPAIPTEEKAVPPVIPTAILTEEKILPPTSGGSKRKPKGTRPADKNQPPPTSGGSKPQPPATPTAEPVEASTSAPAGQVPQKPVTPAAVEIPPPTQLPTPGEQPTDDKKECMTVAIPSPSVIFPGAPLEEKGKPTAKGNKTEEKPEVVPEPIPLPAPESPTAAPSQQQTAKVPEAPKQRKGVFSRILQMVGVAPVEKNDAEEPQSVFYDVQGAAEEAKEVEQASEVKEKPEGEEPKEQLPPPKTAVRKEEKAEQQEEEEEDEEEVIQPTPRRAMSLQEKKVGIYGTRKSPSRKLAMPQNPPATVVTAPTPPAQSSGLLKVEETILETPPVTGLPKEKVAEAIKGKLDDIIGKAKSEVESMLQDRRSSEKDVGESTDLINTMKLMVGASEPGKAEEVEELKVTTEEERKRHKGEVVTSKLSDQILKAIPPPRRKAISESSSSTASIPKGSTGPDQQRIPPQRQKTTPERQKSASRESKPSKSPKPSSIPVPPPRSRGKPSTSKSKEKKTEK